MLLETKAITELGLTFGNTWQVVGISILGILVMAFLAIQGATVVLRQSIAELRRPMAVAVE